MVRIVMEKDALDAMEHLLARHGPSAATGEALRRELDRAAHQVAHRRAILGERCFGIATYSSDPSDTELSMRDIGLLARLVPGPSRRLDQARYLRLMARALELSARPWYDAAGDWDGLIVEARDEPWFGGSGGFAVGGTAEFWATGVAHRARLAMAAFSLDMGPTPIDPFTGRPFAVSAGEDGLSVIRSPGPDPESTADDIAWKWRAR
jgi:hypothetical protein